jgi:hypothetical protein
MRNTLLASLLLCSSCALLDQPVQVVDPDNGKTVEVPLGDAIADNSESVATAVGGVVGGFNPVLGLLAAGAAGSLLAGARRKKQV